MKILCVIPARYKSSRFPGKPLADLCGRPMVWWVYQQTQKIPGLDAIVATDSEIIQQVCYEQDIPVIITSDQHPTGVDRLAEVAKSITADYYLLVQGDEPLLEPETIQCMLDKLYNECVFDGVRTFKTPIKNPVDAVNYTIIKIVTDVEDNVLIASRSPIPYPKNGIEFQYYKSVGVYLYPREILLRYPTLRRGYLEMAEDHDFMRMLENGIKVKAYTVTTSTLSVDTPKDLERVRKIMEEKRNGIDFKE